MFFHIKTPVYIRKYFSKYLWKKQTDLPEIYLTFDDGPHPEVTEWIIDTLKEYDVKATFFCLGKNVEKHPSTYQRLQDEGHRVALHGYNHLNGWKTNYTDYIKDFEQSESSIKSDLFRPPYGKIKKKQAKYIMNKGYQIVMWDIIAGDWKQDWPSDRILRNIISNVEEGSIIVLHDSEKAFQHVQYVVPKMIEELKAKNYQFKTI